MQINSSPQLTSLQPVVRNTGLSLLVLGVAACGDDGRTRDATETNLERTARDVLAPTGTARASNSAQTASSSPPSSGDFRCSRRVSPSPSPAAA